MHGFMTPAEVEMVQRPSLATRAKAFWRRRKWFLIVVVAPTLLAAAYLYAMASDQYISEAHFLVRTQGSSTSSSSSGGLSSAMGFSSGSSLAAMGEAQSVADYLTSHDVVETLQKKLNLVAMFRRPEADPLSRLPIADPTPEFLLRYYRKQVDVYFDLDNGITTLTARTFRPEDSFKLASALLALGEERVNEMNLRGFADAVAISRRQLDESERSIAALQGRMTQFRQAERDVDPEGTATAQISLVSRLEQELSAAKAQLQTTTKLIGGSGPQAEALRQQITSLESQLAGQTNKLTGGNDAIAAGLGDYEKLKIQQELLTKRYDTAMASYEAARQQAVRAQLYLVRVVNPNMPVKSLYPKRALFLVTLFFVLLIVYAIGWLIAAGVREHAV